MVNPRLIFSIFLFSTLTNSIFCSSVILLRSVDNVNPQTYEVEKGAGLYLGYGDKAAPLSRIQITNGANTITAQSLLSYINDDGSQKPFILTDGNLTITKTNTMDVTLNMSSYLYITTSDLENDSNFLVYVAQGNKTINRNSSDESTVVVLNSDQSSAITDVVLESYHFYNSIVRNIVQPNTTTLSIRQDFPALNYTDPKIQNATIFRNPIELDPFSPIDKQPNFFENIETFQIPLQIWYIYAIGGFTLDVEGAWVNPTSYTTTSITTTGLLTNDNFGNNKTVNFLLNPANNRTIGNYVTVNPRSASMNFTFVSDTSIFLQSYGKGSIQNNALIFSFMQAKRLDVTTDSRFFGAYFSQYFGIDGNTLPTTPSTPSTTSTVTSTVIPTTTGLSGGFSIIPTILSLIFIYF